MLITGDIVWGKGYIWELCTFCSTFFKRKPTLKKKKQKNNPFQGLNSWRTHHDSVPTSPRSTPTINHADLGGLAVDLLRAFPLTAHLSPGCSHLDPPDWLLSLLVSAQ